MKIQVDVEITPQEMRRLFGLPDMEAFHRQLLDDVRERMTKGADGYDPLKLMQPYVSGALASWDLFQRMASGLSAAGARTPESGPSEG
jgi:hypothetical protein